MDEDNENTFEGMPLSDLWRKRHVLDHLDALEQAQVTAQNGAMQLQDILQMDDELILRSKLAGYNLMKTHLEILLQNVSHEIDKKIILQTKLQLSQAEKDEQDNELVYIFSDEVSKEKLPQLTQTFYDCLNRLISAKTILVKAIADAEILTPKKSGKNDKKLSEEISYE